MAVRLLMKASIDQIVDEGGDIRSFYFKPEDRGHFPPVPAGAHTLLRVAKGMMRQYSLCTPPGDSRYRVAIRLDAFGRGGSRVMHEAARVGDVFYLSYPQPDFPLDPDRPSYSFFAGGVGITPILSFLYALRGRACRIRLCYFARADGAVPFEQEVRTLCPQVEIFNPTKNRPVNFKDLLRGSRDDAIYCCGGTRFVAGMQQAAEVLGLADIHVESFVSVVKAGYLGEPFVVDLPRSRHVLQVPSDRTMLEVLLEDGVDIDYACEAGVCRSCIVDVIEGEIIHRDQCLTDEERRTLMTPCVSRGRGRTVINSL
ncbi:PDR/VanB family oxidoreductase [Nguyenibacter sp. L1]|uniref:PDR/VanB family oxidoreductase n=1 Tax=Nguyenibacter sp. L1 TaxID=3049350 RepID=UPI002B4A92A3|nr:PDR/VanB family oxidoreductase [Nguyenibacter sp. L1]WRH86642.1 PDR/VanB family oxidoreductase [Nguyenibacter sp. L1]